MSAAQLEQREVNLGSVGISPSTSPQEMPSPSLDTDCQPSGELKIDMLGGNCPVQGEGSVDGQPFYFRARGNRWTFSVGPNPVAVLCGDAKGFHYEEAYKPDEEYAAGWMDEDEARRFIEQAAAEYRRAAASNPEDLP